MSIRLAIVTDIHHGLPSHTKRGDTAALLMKEFAEFVRESGVTHVLDLGDRISDIDRVTDLRLEKEVAEMFRDISVPVWHINGNHDRDHLSVADNEEILGQSLGHEVHDLGDWRIILWRADSQIHRNGQHSFQLPEADLLWLAAQMQKADRPVLVASHVPVSGHSQIGNYYFERSPRVDLSAGSPRARSSGNGSRAGCLHHRTCSLEYCDDSQRHHASHTTITDRELHYRWRTCGCDGYS